jgi:hypothetical protein
VERNGEPIQSYPLNNQVSTGITWQTLVPGLVAELEEREAAISCGYTWKEWLSFDLRTFEGRIERASGIAHYRMHKLMEMHGEDAVSRETDRRQRMAAHRN